MNKQKNFLLNVVTVVVLSLQLMSPITVFADDATPPPPDSTTEVTTTPDPAEQTVLPEMTETPAPPELTLDPIETASPAPITESAIPVETEASAPSTDQVATETAEETVEAPTVSEVLQQIPEGTDVIVLDANGEPEPLTTQDAAEIITTGDPMWCPDGVLPGGVGCTPSFTTVTELNTALSSSLYSGSGTIYFTSTYSTDDVYFDGTYLYYLADLTIQGGWNGLTGSSFALSGNTVFDGVQVIIMNWNGNVTVNNITVDGAVGSGLGVQTNGADVTINDSSFINNQLGPETLDDYPVYYGDGGSIFTNGGNITVDSSHFDGNYWDGLYAVNAGQINITNSTFNDNQIGSGVNFDQTYGQTSNIVISNSIFNGNVIGIEADATDIHGEPTGFINLDINCVQFTNNSQNISQYGNVTITDVPCPPPSPTSSPTPSPTPQPIIVIPVEGGKVTFKMDCSLFSSYIPVWPNGDRVLISCVPNGTVNIDRVENTNLPSEMTTGYKYASGFNIQIFQNGAPLSVMPEDGPIQVSFVATESDAVYGIMYWDTASGDWTLLNAFQKNPNGTPMQFSVGSLGFMTLRGTQFVPGNPNREEVTTNFTGTFVLVIQE